MSDEHLHGWPAFAFARILRRHWRDDVLDLPPQLRLPLERALEGLEEQAAAWAEEMRRRKGGGNEPAGRAETGLHSEWLSGSEVAALLGVSDRRVRQLAAAGLLSGHRDPLGHWRIERRGVEALRKARCLRCSTREQRPR